VYFGHKRSKTIDRHFESKISMSLDVSWWWKPDATRIIQIARQSHARCLCSLAVVLVNIAYIPESWNKSASHCNRSRKEEREQGRKKYKKYVWSRLIRKKIRKTHIVIPGMRIAYAAYAPTTNGSIYGRVWRSIYPPTISAGITGTSPTHTRRNICSQDFH
jgi:hypothetical protein